MHYPKAYPIPAFTQQNAILCNVGVLTTGFDEPSIETIILNRATKSLSLYLQMVGRGSRLSENKEKFLVLDLGKNTTRHGAYTDYFDWQAYFQHGAKLNGLMISRNGEEPEGATDSAAIFQANWSKIKSQ